MTETNQPLDGRAILIAPVDAQVEELTAELMRQGARVITCPRIEITDSESFAALDEAIQNLFGYDWVIFTNPNAAGSFVRRLQNLSHEISELDALRVCALNETTREQLEESQVHVDLIPETSATDGVMAALETYNGGRDAIRGLNFLVPRAANSRDHLPQALEDAGARVDIVAAYRTTGSRNSELVQLGVLLEGGGVDCVVFTNPASVRGFARLLDTNDLVRVLKEVVVACVDHSTARATEEFGLRAQIVPSEPGVAALVPALTSFLATGR